MQDGTGRHKMIPKESNEHQSHLFALLWEFSNRYVFVFKWNLIFSMIHGTNVLQIKFKQNDEPLKYGPSQMQQYFVNA